jgi:hypothetical protein
VAVNRFFLVPYDDEVSAERFCVLRSLWSSTFRQQGDKDKDFKPVNHLNVINT